MIDFREIYIAELKAVGFSASDAEEIAAWYLGAPGTTPFPAHCRRVALAASGYDPSQPRNADGEWTSGGGSSRAPSETTEQPVHTPTTSENVAKFLQDTPDRISPAEADALLATGFEDKDGAGNTVKYGQLLRDHIDRESHSEKDRIARKQRLGVAVKVIRAAIPQPSGDVSKPNERVYAGTWNGKAYVGIADEHGEMNAMLMVSYRRDGRHDEK